MMKRKHVKAAFVWLMVGVFSTLTAIVYEYFSHGVWSVAMMTMPLWPLVFGAGAMYLFDRRLRLRHRAGGWPRMFWHCGVATAQWGSFIAGVKEIYGVHNPYGVVFFALADILFISAVVLYLTSPDPSPKKRRS